MKKILFLDIDGVLNTERWHKKMMESHAPKDSFGYDFDPEAVANLRRIIEATGAEIVISSSWKGYGMDGLQELWETRDLPGKVIDMLPEQMPHFVQTNYEVGISKQDADRVIEILNKYAK